MEDKRKPSEGELTDFLSKIRELSEKIFKSPPGTIINLPKGIEPRDIPIHMAKRRLPNIVLIGPAGSGKDTVADILNGLGDYQRLAFGDEVKRISKMLRDWPFATAVYFVTEVCSVKAFARPETISEDFTRFSMMPKDDLKDRALLQAVGEYCRGIDPEVWITAAFKRLKRYDPEKPVVITDCRYANEFIHCCAEGFIPVAVCSPEEALRYRIAKRDFVSVSYGFPNYSHHASETNTTKLIPLCDFFINNDGTQQDLIKQVQEILKRIRKE